MSRRSDCCALIIGGLLLLAAALLMSKTGLAANHHEQANQALRIAQAVTALHDGCLTCHSSPSDTPAILPHPAVSFESVDNTASLDAQLYALGRRIEALPDRQDARRQEVVTAFLQTYDETRGVTAQAAAPQVVRRALERLDGIESLLQVLENQASPYRVSPQDGKSFQPDATVLSAAPGSPGAAVLDRGVPLGDQVFNTAWVVIGARQCVRPQDIVSATRRRGPPAGLVLDSV